MLSRQGQVRLSDPHCSHLFSAHGKTEKANCNWQTLRHTIVRIRREKKTQERKEKRTWRENRNDKKEMDRSIDVPDFHLKCGFFIVKNSKLTPRQNRIGLDPLHDCSKIFFYCCLYVVIWLQWLVYEILMEFWHGMCRYPSTV